MAEGPPMHRPDPDFFKLTRAERMVLYFFPRLRLALSRRS